MAVSLTGSPERMNRLRARFPVRFAAGGGLAIAVIGLVTGGATFGAGSAAVKHMLEGHADVPSFYVTLKFIATWLARLGWRAGRYLCALALHWCRGGAQRVTAGGGGHCPGAHCHGGMAAFLAAVTQAPLTAFIIVMEMVDGHAVVLSLVSRMLARPLYETLALYMVAEVTAPPPPDPPPPP